MKRMLIVNDEQATARSFEDLFQHEGFDISLAFDEAQAYKKLNSEKPDIVVLDMDLRGKEEDISGIRILEHIRKTKSPKALPVIIISRYLDGDKIEAVERAGINDNDYFPYGSDIPGMLRHVNSYFEETPEGSSVKAKPELLTARSLPYFRAPKSIELLKDLKRFAKAKKDIVFIGEAGVGKTMLAQYYWTLLSPKSGKKRLPYVRIPCTGLTEDFFDTELFGRENGPGKVKSPGLLEAGRQGAVFFDDVGFLSKNLQIRMLDLLGTKKYRLAGSHLTRDLNCVFVMALHERQEYSNLDDAFRGRLGHMATLRIPPLRERLEDIPGLAERLVPRFNLKHRRRVVRIHESALELLKSRTFPGNYSDLETILEEGVLKCPGETLTVEDIREIIKKIEKFQPDHGGENPPPKPACERFKELAVWPERREAWADKTKLELRPMEFELLLFFIRRPRRYIERSEIREYLHQGSEVTENATNTHIKNLREKLGKYDCYIKTVRPKGYMLSD